MSIELRFKCDGCSAEADGTESMRREFVSVSGRSYGIGTAQWRKWPDELAPQGWMASDPYTYCTYCPKCWNEIQSPPAENPNKSEDENAKP